MNPRVRARAFALAELIATWSTDGLKTGAVLVDERSRVVGMGWNGFHKGLEEIGESHGVVHAEANAILQFTGALLGCTMFVTGLPCLHCIAFIVKAGVQRVVVPAYALLDLTEFRIAKHLLTAQGVELQVEARDRPAG